MAKEKYIKPNKIKRNKNPFALQSGRYKDGKIDSLYRSPWAEDAYISEAGQRDKVGQQFPKKRLPLYMAFFVLFIFLLLSRSAWLQIVKGDEYFSQAEGNRIRITRIEPKRGVIYDRNMKALVRNKANFMLYLVPIDLPEDENELDSVLDVICEVYPGFDKEEIVNSIKSVSRYSLEAYQPLFVEDNIPYEQAMLLHLVADRLPGVIISNRTRREYLKYYIEDSSVKDWQNTDSHLIGYTGKINDQELKSFGDEYLPIDYIGKMGVEFFWENELKGQSGNKQIEVDALGKEKKILGQSDPQDGNNLRLSLDIIQQLKLEEILISNLRKINKSKAMAIVMNPQNGEILAMVSLPSFDNNAFARGITVDEYEALITHEDKPLFNRAVSGEYPSGSTIKPVIAVSALEEGVVSEHTSFLSTGGLSIGQWYFPDWRAGGHGRTNVRSAIANSVNTYFYYIGGGYEDFRGLGVDKIVEYGELFGLGAQTGIDLAGEKSGFLPTREWKENERGERWYIGDTYHLAIGQGDLLVTPLQVAVFTSVFASRGKLFRPHLVKEILDSDDLLLRSVETDPVRDNFLDNYNVHVVREGMRDTVRYGSARSMQVVGAEVAGKTGTAQWSSKHDNHAWFTGFAPFDDPELTITVLVEQGGEGSSVAVPIAREYLQWYFSEYKPL